MKTKSTFLRSLLTVFLSIVQIAPFGALQPGFLDLPIFGTPIAQAAIPNTIGYQGRLRNSSGNPLSGTFSFTFRLYGAATGGSVLWNEVQSIAVTDGFLTAQLGAVTPFPVSVDFNEPLFFTVEVGSDGEMSPRIPVNSVPYSQTTAGINALASAPVAATGGRMYYDVTNGSLNYYDQVAGIWKTLSSASGSSFTSLNFTSATGVNANISNLTFNSASGSTLTLNGLTVNGAAPSSIANLTWVNATGTNTTSTNLFATNGTLTNGTITNGTISNLTFANGTSTSWFGFATASGTTLNALSGTIATLTAPTLISSNATISGGSINGTPIGATTPSTGVFTNVTSTNATTTNFFATNGTIANLTVTGVAPTTFANLIWTNATGTNTTSTNLFATNLQATNGAINALTFTNGTSTSWLGFNTASGTNLFASSVLVNGQSVCLTNGVNCPVGSTTDTLATVTAQGATTTQLIYALGGIQTLNLTATGTLAVLGQTTLQDLTFRNATGTNLAIGSVNATSVTATTGSLGSLNVSGISGLNGLTFTNATGTSATTTNLFSTNAAFTNLAVGSLGLTNLTWVNATGTNTTSTNLAVLGNVSSNLIPSADAVLSLGSPALRWNAILGTVTSTNAIFTNASSTNFFSSLIQAGNVVATTGTFTNLIATTGNVTTLISSSGTIGTLNNTALNGGAATFTNVTTTHFFATNGLFTNVTSTNIAATTVSTTQLFVNGQLISGSFGVPATTATLQTITNNGATTTNPIYALGGINTSNLNVTGTLSVAGATSLQNFTFGLATGTSVTTTNLFSTNGNFTNLAVGILSPTNITWTNATGTNTTSTNFFTTNGVLTNGTISNLTFGNGTSTSWFGFTTASGTTINANAGNIAVLTAPTLISSNATISGGSINGTPIGSTVPSTGVFTNVTSTNATSTNLFATNLSGTNASFANLSLSGNLAVSGITWTNATGTNTTSTNLFVSGTASTTQLFANAGNIGTLTAGAGTITTLGTTFLTASQATTTILSFGTASGTSLFASSIQVNGSNVCLANGANCPPGGAATPTLAVVTAQGATTTDMIYALGGIQALSLTATGTLVVFGQSTLQDLAFRNATGTNLAIGAVNATSVTAATGSLGALAVSGSSVLNGLTFTNATGTSVTTTNLFSTNGSFTNLSVGSLGLTNLTWVNATGTNVTTTNLAVLGNVSSNLIPSADAVLSLGSPALRWNAILGTVTSTNAIFTNASSTNLFANLIQGGSVVATTGTFTNLIATTGNITTLISSSGTIATLNNSTLNGGVATFSNVTTTHFFATNGLFTNVTSTNIAATTVSTTQLFVNGQQITAGSQSTTATLQTITNNGATTTNLITAYGGINTSNLNVTGTLSVAGATSLQNFTFGLATGTSVTTTNLFSTNGNFTNLVVGNLSPTNLTWTNATGTNTTSTNFFTTNGVLTNGTISNLTFGNGTSTSWFGFTTASGTTINANAGNIAVLTAPTLISSNATISGGSINGTPIGATTPSTGVFTNVTSTNATSTNFFATNIAGTNASFANLSLSGNLAVSNLTWTNATGTNTTSTNFFATNGTITNGTVTNLTAAGATTTNLFVSGTASTTQLFANAGSIGTLTAGAGTITTLGTTFLTASQATTTILSFGTASGTSLFASSVQVNGMNVCLQNGVNCPAATGDSVWFDNVVSNFIRPATSSRDVVIGSSASGTAPFYFDVETPTSSFQIGRAGNANLFVGAPTYSGGLNAAFLLNGDDAFIQGNLGVASSVYTNGALVAANTYYTDGIIGRTTGNLTLDLPGGFLLPSTDLGIALGSASLRFNGNFGSVTSTAVTTTNLFVSGTASTTQLFANAATIGTLTGGTGSFSTLTASQATSTIFAFTNASGSSLSVGSLLVGGNGICLQNGTNCPSGTATDTLATVTAQGASTTHQLYLFGGFLAASSTVTSTFTVIGQTNLTNVSSTNLSTSGNASIGGNVTVGGSTLLNGLTFTNATGTSVTTTNLFSTNGSFTNLSVGSLGLTNLTWVNATGTNTTSTNLAVLGNVSSNLIPSVDAALSLGSPALRWNAILGTVTSTNAIFINTTSTNLFSNLIQGGSVVATTGTFTNLIATTGNITTLISSSGTIATLNNTTLNGGAATFTNASSTYFFATNALFTNVTSTNIAATTVSTTQLFVNGQQITSGAAATTATLQTITNNGATTTNLITALGGINTSNLTVTGTLSVTGPTSLQNFTFGLATGTSVTTTNLFSTNGNFTNLSVGTLSPTNITWTNATGTNTTSTNFFTTNGVMTNGTISNLTFGNGTSTSWFGFTTASGTTINANAGNIAVLTAPTLISSNATISGGSINGTPIGTTVPSTGVFTNVTSTNATSTNFFATNLSGTNASFANMTLSGGLTVSNLVWTNATGTNTTSTNFFATNGTITNGTVTNLTAAGATTTNLFVSGVASTTQLFANAGNIGTLTAGAGTITTLGTTLLTASQATTTILSFGTASGTSLFASSIQVNGSNVCLQNGVNCPGASQSTATLQTITNNGATTTNIIYALGGIQTLNLTATGTLTALGQTTLQDLTFRNATGTNLAIGSVNATSVTATTGSLGSLTVSGSSALNGLTFTNATGTSVTTTNLFSTNGNFTNLAVGTLSPVNITWTNATGTNTTSTNFFTTNGVMTNGTVTNLTFGNGTSTSWFGFTTASGTTINANAGNIAVLTAPTFISSNATISGGSIDGTPIGATTPSTGVFTNVTSTNATSTNFFATNVAGTNASFANLALSGNLSVSGVTWTNATGTNTTSTNLFATNGTITNLVATGATTTNLFVSGVASTTQLFASAGNIGTLTAGAGTITTLGTTLLTASQATTTILSFGTASGTNLFASSIQVNGSNVCLQNGVNCPGAAQSTATLQTITNNGATTTNIIYALGGIQTLNLTATGTLAVLGQSTLQDLTFRNATGTNLAISSVNATSVTAATANVTSLTVTGATSLQNFTFGLATGTSVTTTNLFSTNGSFTNLSVGTLSPTNITWTNATGTNTTSTNFFTTNGVMTNGTVTNLTFGNGTSTSWFGFTTASGTTINANAGNIAVLTAPTLISSNATITGGSINGTPIGATVPSTGVFTNVTSTNATSTNFFATNITGTNASFANMTLSGSLAVSNLTWTNATGTNTTSTNFFATNGTITNGTVTNLTAGGATTTNLFVSGVASTTQLFANAGSIGTLTAGTGNITSLTAGSGAFTTLMSSQSTSTIFAFTSASGSSLLVSGQNVCLQNGVNCPGATQTTATLQTITNNGATTTNIIYALGGIQALNLTATGTLAVLAQSTLQDLTFRNATGTNLAIGSVNATSVTATTASLGSLTVSGLSALNGLTFTNATGTSVTTTNLFSTNGSFTNLSVGTLSPTNLTWTNATGTNTTSTNFFTTNGVLTNGTVSNLTFGNGTSTSWFGFTTASGSTINANAGNIAVLTAPTLISSNATISGGSINGTPIGATTPSTGVFTNVTSTNATSTNFFATNISGTNASFANLSLSGGLTVSNLVWTNATGTNTTSTNFFATNGTITNGTVTNLTAAGATTTNLFVSGTASTTQLFANAGNIGTLTAGAGTITTLGTTFLTASQATTTILSFGTASGTSLFASSIQVNGSNVCLQNGVNCPGASQSTATLQTITNNGATTTNVIYALGGIQTLNLTATGTLAVLGQTTLQDLTFRNATGTNLAIGSVNATSVTATTGSLVSLTVSGSSALNGLTFTNATGTSVTTTNLFSTNGSFTNLSVATLSPTNITWTNATGTNTTSTNFFTTNGVMTNGTISNLTFGNGTSTSWFGFTTASGTTINANAGNIAVLTAPTLISSNATISGGSINGTPIGATTPSTGVFTNVTSTNTTSTNFFATNLSATNATIANLALSGNLAVSGLTWTNATGTNTTSTNFFATNGTITNGTVTNLTAAGATTTNLFVSGVASTTQLFANAGSIGTLTAGTGNITSLTAGSGSFTSLTASQSTSTVLAFTSASGSSLLVSGQNVCLQNGVNCPVSGGGGGSDSNWVYDATSGFLRPVTTTNDLVLGATASATAPFYFDANSPTSSLQIGRVGNGNLFVGTSSYGNILNSLFGLNGDDAFIQGNLGVASSVYTNGSVVVGSGTFLNPGRLTTIDGDLTVSSSNNLILQPGGEANVGGRVGIGTSNPTALLQVGNGGTISPETAFAVTTANVAGQQTNVFREVTTNSTLTMYLGNFLSGGGGYAGLGTATAIPFQLFVNGTDGLTIWGNQNVGIGTNDVAPLTKLEVVGAVSSTGIWTRYVVPYINNAYSLGSATGSFANVYASGTAFIGTNVIVNGQNVCLQNGTNCPVGGGGGSDSNWVYDATSGFLRPVTSTNDIVFGATASATAPFYFDFSTPTSSLQIGRIGNANLFVGTSTYGGGLNSLFALNGDDTFLQGNLGVASSVYTNGAFVAGTGSRYGDGFITRSNGSITASSTNGNIILQPTAGGYSASVNGRVGIGTTNPQSRLHVGGDGSPSLNTTMFLVDPLGPLLEMRDTTNNISGFLGTHNNDGTLGVSLGTLNSNTYLSLFTENARALTIEPGQNVGIGTVDPTYKLDVVGTVSSTNIITGSHFVRTNNVFNLGTASGSFANIYASGTAFIGADVIVNGQSVCLVNGTNCPVGGGGGGSDSNWVYNALSGFLRPVTSTNDLVLGATASATAPFYFDANSPTSSLQIGRVGNANLFVGTSTYGGGLNSAFTVNGDEAFIQGNLGVASSVYSNGAFITGLGSTLYGDGFITKTNGDLVLSAALIRPATNNSLSLGSPTSSFANVYASGTAFVGSILVNGLNVCLESGANCPIGGGGGGSDSNWLYNSTSGFLRPVTTTNDLVLGAAASATAPFYFDANSPTSSLQIGRVGNGNLFVGTSSYGNILNSLFGLDGDDTFIQGNLGVASSVYTNGSVVVGSGTFLNPGRLTTINGDLTVSSSNNLILQPGGEANVGGRVGIGTSNPTALLQVGNLAGISAETAFAVSTNNGAGQQTNTFREGTTNTTLNMYLGNFGISGGYVGIGTMTTAPLQFFVNGTDGLTIWGSQNVGIGTNDVAPNTKLEVVGAVSSTGMWARYIVPQRNNLYNLGSATGSWANFYASGTAFIANAQITNATTTNATTTNLFVSGSVRSNLLPSSDGVLSLGTSTLRWTGAFSTLTASSSDIANGLFTNVTSTNSTSTRLYTDTLRASTGNFLTTLMVNGTNVCLENGTNCPIGGGAGVATDGNWVWNVAGGFIRPATTTNDVFIGGSTTATAPFYFDVNPGGSILSVVGTASATTIIAGTVTSTNFVGAGLSDCDAADSKLLWDATTQKFSCGRDFGANLKATSSTTVVALTPAKTRLLLGTVTTTPAAIGNEVLLTGFVSASNTAATVKQISVVIFRGNGAFNGCAAPGIQVGATTTVTLQGNIGVSENIAFNIVDAPATSTAVGYSLCAQTSVATVSVAAFQITAEEVNFGADLAEVYYSMNDEFTPGEVVSLDPSGEGLIRLPSRAYDPHALGVVSTRPGLVMSNQESNGGTPYMIALAGRIPVKVSLENGSIEVGDALAVSSRPGYAMKATRAGSILGRALSGYEVTSGTSSEETGLVMMFVQNGYYVPPVDEEDEEGIMILDESSNDDGEDVTVLPEETSSEPTFRITDHAEFGGEVSVLKHLYQGEDAAGYAKFLMNSTEVRVAFKDHYLYPPVVNVTPQAEIRTPYWIEEVDETGFTIRMAEGVEDRDVEFAWIVSAVKEPLLYVSDGTRGKRSEEEEWRGLGTPSEELETSTSTEETSPTEEAPTPDPETDVPTAPSEPESETVPETDPEPQPPTDPEPETTPEETPEAPPTSGIPAE